MTAAKSDAMATRAISDVRILSSSGAVVAPPNAIAIKAAAAIASAGQYQRLARGVSSASSDRHSALSPSRIGYSATHENENGAIRPANSPPTMPPNESAT